MGMSVGVFVAVFAVHVAAIVGLIFAGLWAAEQIQEEPIELTFFGAPPPPPPPPPAGRKKKKKKKKTRVAEVKPRQEMVQPEEIPEDTPEESDDTPEEEVEGGVDGGVEGGVVGGVVGGVIGGVLGGTGNPLDVGAVGIRPIPLYTPNPPYPRIAKKAGIEGRVTLEIIVSTDGRVTDVKIIKGQPPFDGPAVATVKKWRFKPVVWQGRRIVWRYKLTVRFELT